MKTPACESKRVFCAIFCCICSVLWRRVLLSLPFRSPLYLCFAIFATMIFSFPMFLYRLSRRGNLFSRPAVLRLMRAVLSLRSARVLSSPFRCRIPSFPLFRVRPASDNARRICDYRRGCGGMFRNIRPMPPCSERKHRMRHRRESCRRGVACTYTARPLPRPVTETSANNFSRALSAVYFRAGICRRRCSVFCSRNPRGYAHRIFP